MDGVVLRSRLLKPLLPAAERPPPPLPLPARAASLPQLLPGRAAAAIAMQGVAMQGPQPPPAPAVAAPGGPKVPWLPAQVAQLHRQLAQHVQLLVTTFAAATKLSAGGQIACTVGHCIHGLQVPIAPLLESLAASSKFAWHGGTSMQDCCTCYGMRLCRGQLMLGVEWSLFAALLTVLTSTSLVM